MPCVGHLVHNAVSKALEDEVIKSTLMRCRRIVSLIHASQTYRNKLTQTQKSLKISQKQLVNDVSTRWGSKYKMLTRIKEQMPATNHIFVDEKKHRDLTIPWQESEHIDQILKALYGFNKLTDLLSEEKEVTISSVIPLLRHIYELCEIGEDEYGTLTADIKSSIKKYIALKLDLFVYSFTFQIPSDKN